MEYILKKFNIKIEILRKLQSCKIEIQNIIIIKKTHKHLFQYK